MGNFVLYHISDLHFSEEPYRCPIGNIAATAYAHRVFKTLSSGRSQFAPSHNAEVAEALAMFLLTESDVTTLLVTGDLATTGHPADLRQAFRFFDGQLTHCAGKGGQPNTELATRVGSILDVIPTIVLPGNHDRFEAADFRGGRTRFESASFFGPRWRPSNSVFKTDFGAPAGLVHSFHLRHRDDDEILSICCADFTVIHRRPKCYAYIGRGEINQHILTELEDVTRRCRQELGTTLVIWAVHFPPEFAGVDWFLELASGAELIRAAGRSEVPVVIAGHTHEAREYPIRTDTGSVRVITCGTTLEMGVPTEELHCQRIRLTVKNGVLADGPVVHPLYYREYSGQGQYNWR